MNYNAFFDGFFSHLWLSWGLLLVYVVVMVLLKKRLFGGRGWLPTAFFIYFIPIVWVLTIGFANPLLLGYGNSIEVTGLSVANGKLYATDYLRTSGGKTYSGAYSFRLHMLEPATGQKQRRRIVGDRGTVIYAYGDTLAFAHSDNITFYSIATGKEINSWSEKTLPHLFPQLAPGVKRLVIDRPDSLVEVSSLNGNKWFLDIRKNSIAPFKERYANNYVPGRIRLMDHSIVIDGVNSTSTLIALGEIKGSDQKSVICSWDSIINRHTRFLHGEIVAFSVKDSCFVVRDYDDLNQARVDYTCMSLDGKNTRWQVRQSELRPSDGKKQVPSVFCLDDAAHIFFASYENEVVAIDLSNGKILWRQLL